MKRQEYGVAMIPDYMNIFSFGDLVKMEEAFITSKMKF